MKSRCTPAVSPGIPLAGSGVGDGAGGAVAPGAPARTDPVRAPARGPRGALGAAGAEVDIMRTHREGRVWSFRIGGLVLREMGCSSALGTSF